MSGPIKPPEVYFDPYKFQHGERCAHYTLSQELYDSKYLRLGVLARVKDEILEMQYFNGILTNNLQIRAFKNFTEKWQRVCANIDGAKHVGWLIPRTVEQEPYRGIVTVAVLIKGKRTNINIMLLSRIFNDTREMNPAITNSMLGGRRSRSRCRCRCRCRKSKTRRVTYRR